MSETFVSSSALLNVVMEKAKSKKRKVVKKPLSRSVLVPFAKDSDSGSNEPQTKKTKNVEMEPVVEPAVVDISSAPTVVRPEVKYAVVDQTVVRADEEIA